MNNDAVKFLKKCLEIYSPSGKEEKYSQFLAKFLSSHNFKVKFDSIGNLIAEKGIGVPTLLLSSHMDTIPGELPIREENGILFGRGAVDCKSSLAAMVYSISKYNFNKGKIIFAGIVQEESSLLGIKEFIKSNIKPDFAIFGEPTKIDQLCIGYKGRLCIKYSVSTEMGHVASSWLYVNAIEICLKIWNIIKKSCKKLTEKFCKHSNNTEYFNQIIPNLTVISGGDLTNCIPSNAFIQIDIRFPPSINSQEILEVLENKITNIIQNFQKKMDLKITVRRDISSQVEGFEIKGTDIITSALRWAVFKTINKKPKLIKKTGTTFINEIGSHFKIPSITYGPGDPKLEHTDIEHIEIEEYLNSIEIYNKFFFKFFELYQKKYQN
jgi:LysW-gamma-L-lysine carboxypeptidase